MKYRKRLPRAFSLDECFNANVDRSGGPEACWPWTGSRSKNRYGVLSFKKARFYAHRLAYALANGAVPDGMDVCHHCDNPPCCNARHLFTSDAAGNAADMVAKGRWRGPLGLEHPKSKLTPELIAEARAQYAAGRSLRSIARDFKMSHQALSAAMRGKTWRAA